MDTIPIVMHTKGVTGKEFLVNLHGVKGCIMDRFIFIGRIRLLLNNDFRMLIKEIFVIEVDMADNAQTVCDNAEFIGITKMPVDVKLFDILISRSVGRHGSISSFVRVIVIIKMHSFCISFQLPDDAVGIFGIVFRDPCFDPGRIKDGHFCFSRINSLVDWLSKINKALEDQLDIHHKSCLKCVILEASETLSNPQNSRRCREYLKKTRSRESVGIEKIR